MYSLSSYQLRIHIMVVSYFTAWGDQNQENICHAISQQNAQQSSLFTVVFNLCFVLINQVVIYTHIFAIIAINQT